VVVPQTLGSYVFKVTTAFGAGFGDDPLRCQVNDFKSFV
jgi:hypothetical protein